MTKTFPALLLALAFASPLAFGGNSAIDPAPRPDQGWKDRQVAMLESIDDSDFLRL